MKQKTKLTICLAVVTLCMISNLVKAQWWNFYPATSGNNFDQCDETNLIESAGVGDFNGNGVSPASAVHINTNFLGYLTNPTSYPLGCVLRTTAPCGSDNDPVENWIMERCRGESSAEIGQVFNRFNYYNGTDFQFLATQDDGRLVFHTGTSTTLNPNNFFNERMCIYDYNFATDAGLPIPGMVRIGYGDHNTSAGGIPNGYGGILGQPTLFVIGSQNNSDEPQTGARFRCCPCDWERVHNGLI